MRTNSALLLICSLCLAASGLASVESAGGETAQLILNRFGRALQWAEPKVDEYLIPSELPHLCNGDDCCQEDDYASPYRVVMMAPRKTDTLGNRTYTTFYMNLTKEATCYSKIDKAGCCNANVSTIWIDVDPRLKVKFATLNSQPAAIQAVQDSNGFRMGVSPDQYQAFSSSSGTGALLSVTVEGDVTQLCPSPDIGPIKGLCDVILEGGTASDAGACCPRGLSVNGSSISFTPPSGFQCMASSAPTVSPFNIQQLDVSAIINGVNSRFVNYTLKVTSNSQCSNTGPNSCCGMEMSYMTLKVMPDTDVTTVTVNDVQRTFSMAPFNQGNDGSMSLLLDNLGWDKDAAINGKTIVLTVRVPYEANSIPQLFSMPSQGANNGKYGAASYFLHSDDGFCCPSGSTLAVDGPVFAPAPPISPTTAVPPPPPTRPPPPPPPVFPPAPPGTCDPQYPVAMADTSMTVAYYEYVNTASSTDFSFLVTDHNNAACKNQKPYCVDVCGWTLFVNDDIIPSLTYSHDDTSNAGKQVVKRGDQASVTFTYGPSGTQSITYGISAPAGTTLRQLCRANAHPDQGNKRCAAMVKSSANVYSMYFFNEDDVALSNYPPPPPKPSVLCDVSKPMDSSCIIVETGRFNTPDLKSTVVDFLVGNKPTSTGCIAEAADVIVTFKVMLKPDIISELSTGKSLIPRETAVFNSAQSNVMWTWTPPNANMQAHYTFNVAGVKSTADICVQGNPGQPADTCAVQFEGKQNCFLGFVRLVKDTSLTWEVGAEDGGKSRAGIIAPAVAVPIAAVAALALLAFLFMRRKKKQQAEGSAGSAGALAAPLVGASLNSEGDLGRASMASAAASDVQIRLPASPAPAPGQ